MPVKQILSLILGNIATNRIRSLTLVERLRGRAGQAQRLRRLRRTAHLCEHCQAEGRVEVAVEVDHIKPLFKGGTDTDDNTQNLCKRHHDEKTIKDFGHKRVTIGEDGWPT
jgi:5-methylcytosine-specific restriction protein A